MQGDVGMQSLARVLEMEANALIVLAATARVLAERLPPGEVRRFLFEEAALCEESASPQGEADGEPSAVSDQSEHLH